MNLLSSPKTFYGLGGYGLKIEKYITETAWKNGWIKPIELNNEIDQSIGIIGAGPAGLACGEGVR